MLEIAYLVTQQLSQAARAPLERVEDMPPVDRQARNTRVLAGCLPCFPQAPLPCVLVAQLAEELAAWVCPSRVMKEKSLVDENLII